LAELQVSIRTRLQSIRVYVQSVRSIHGHNDLDGTALADSGIKG